MKKWLQEWLGIRVLQDTIKASAKINEASRISINTRLAVISDRVKLLETIYTVDADVETNSFTDVINHLKELKKQHKSRLLDSPPRDFKAHFVK